VLFDQLIARRSDVLTAVNPPTMIVVPLGIIASFFHRDASHVDGSNGDGSEWRAFRFRPKLAAG
jgi:hypothetical protein